MCRRAELVKSRRKQEDAKRREGQTEGDGECV